MGVINRRGDKAHRGTIVPSPPTHELQYETGPFVLVWYHSHSQFSLFHKSENYSGTLFILQGIINIKTSQDTNGRTASHDMQTCKK
jgi:hypothetical protein